jgi:hypothetical protein
MPVIFVHSPQKASPIFTLNRMSAKVERRRAVDPASRKLCRIGQAADLPPFFLPQQAANQL